MKRTPEQRIAAAQAEQLRAEFDKLAERAVAAKMTARQCRAIKAAYDLGEMLGWVHEAIRGKLDRLTEVVADVEQERELARKDTE